LFSSFLPVWAVERFYQGIWIMGDFLCEFATFIRFYKVLNFYKLIYLVF
jgi:hypothetical protein